MFRNIDCMLTSLPWRDQNVRYVIEKHVEFLSWWLLSPLIAILFRGTDGLACPTLNISGRIWTGAVVWAGRPAEGAFTEGIIVGWLIFPLVPRCAGVQVEVKVWQGKSLWVNLSRYGNLVEDKDRH